MCVLDDFAPSQTLPRFQPAATRLYNLHPPRHEINKSYIIQAFDENQEYMTCIYDIMPTTRARFRSGVTSCKPDTFKTVSEAGSDPIPRRVGIYKDAGGTELNLRRSSAPVSFVERSPWSSQAAPLTGEIFHWDQPCRGEAAHLQELLRSVHARV